MNGQTNGRQLLARCGYPDILLDAWEADGIADLLPIQSSALSGGKLDTGSCLVIGPTSCGKTLVGELACVKHALERRRCLYLVPFKAIAEEKYVEFQRKYGGANVGAQVVISTADRRQQDRSIAEGDFNIAILTYEKLAALLVIHPSIVREAGAVVIDEIQMVSDESRGAELELLLTRARQIAPDVQIIGLSAVVSDLNGFDEWLTADVIQDDHRPVALREGVISPDGNFQYLEWNASDKSPGSESLSPLAGTNERELTVSLAKQLLQDENEQVLVFAQTVKNTQMLASAIAAAAVDLSPAKKVLEELTSLEATESVEALSKTLDRAVAFHNGDLTLEERLAVESGFRSGAVRCVVSTSTLSMGVNLPASSVIIEKPQKWTRDASGRWDEVDLSVGEYRNMSGRAGRFGVRKDDYGRSFVIATSPLAQQSLTNCFVKGTPEPLESAFLKRPLEILLLRTIASGLCNTADGSRRFLLKTFAARTAWTTDDAKAELDQEIQNAISRLKGFELIEVDGNGKILVTALGMICASSGLQIETFARLSQFVESGNLSALDIAMIASECDDTGANAVGYGFSTAEYEQRTKHFIERLRECNDATPGKLTEAKLSGFALAGRPDYDRAKEIKYQTVAMSYVSGVASRQIEDQLGITAGRARTIGSHCSWLCDTASQIAWSLGMTEEAKHFEVLGDRFLHGCSEDALLLAQVPHNLHRAEREQLVAAGFTSLQSLVDTSAIEIARTAKVSRARVARLQQGIVDVIGESLELERQQLARLQALGQATELVEPLYALKDKLLEQAIEDLCDSPFCPLTVARITSQRRGEADLKIILSTGKNGIAQVTAKDRATDLVGMKKAGDVLQQSPDLAPQAFICIGRPDFDATAIEKAEQHAQAGRNYKIIAISVLVEMYVRFHEGRITAQRVADILEIETGYITTDRI